MKIKLAFCLIVLLLPLTDNAQIEFNTRVLKDSLFIPWEIAYGPDNHIWFTQKNGYICRMDTAGMHTDTLYHEPATVTIKESGMLGMALHPDFATSPYVYVVWEYLNPAGNIRERLERYTYSIATNTLTSPFIMLDSTHGFIFHNGSRLVIVDDKLFVTVGDATDNNDPQNLNSINGKILRLNLDGSIPADNPIVGSPIWTWGHRNPQGLVWANGILFSSEHGPDTDDEINIIKKGSNYGWPNVKGFCDQPDEITFCADSNVTEPVHAWTPTIAPCGIDYYHHPMFPTLQNSLLMTTLKDQHLYQLQLNDSLNAITGVSVIDGINFGRLRDICISPEGKIFISTSNSNPADTGARIDRIVEIYNPHFRGTENSMTLYPNPSSDNIYISIPGTYKQLEYRIYNVSDGRKISEGSLDYGRPFVHVADFPDGIYQIILKTDKGIKYERRFVRATKK